MTIPTPETVRQILQAADPCLRAFVGLCAFGGLRLGAAAALQVTDGARPLASAGMSGVRLHDLRHFYASGLIASGCHVVAVQRALGHAKSTTTLTPSPASRTSAARRVDASRTQLYALGHRCAYVTVRGRWRPNHLTCTFTR